ncbi:hypothetical protein KC19_9G035300 [Ceratodon purpureus]|uniref:AP2/ERF domain-containing protein n=1 Tax=Ceratodon purpureus TaxID=3225 RepID=A0A8T0GVY3_CERPU|nr:hypothetical protein KC19_9G035300 [Ceratodon purpureus]
MAIPLAIDTKGLVELFPFFEEEVFGRHGGGRGRLQIHRICAHATVAHDASTFKHHSKSIRAEPIRQVQQAALDWQPDQEDDLDKEEVFHHLKQLAAKDASMAGISLANDHIPGMTTLLASAQCPTFAARARGRPPSSFHRYSLRTSMFRFHTKEAYGRYFRINHSDMSVIAYKYPLKLFWFRHPIVWADSRENEALVLWQLQFDFVDLSSRTPDRTWRPGNKRRRTVNPFLQVSSSGGDEDTSRVKHAPQAKRLKGVRFRDKRNRWIAEMKPPKHKNKVSFGDFKSQTEAARAVDAAFYYYGKTKQLNFADTPRILSTKPLSLGLSEVEKLSLVKERARWMASIASTIPSSPTSPPSSARNVADDVAASVNQDSSKDLPAIHAQTISSSTLIFEEADDDASSSSVHITGGRSRPESSTGAQTNFVNFPGVEEMCIGYLLMSPPALSMWQMENSCDLGVDFAVGMAEQPSFTCEV